MYTDELDRQLRSRLAMSLGEAGPSDLARLMRAPEFDAGFPGERALPALRETLSGLGIDLDRQPNVELDVAARPGKVPRAFCAPIRVPDRVVLVVLPQGGQEDYAALFHEAGHTEHFAHARRTLPAEERVLGDNAVTEGFAFLLEHLTGDARWLAARLDMPRSDQFVRFSAFVTLFFLRRYCAKLRYELELHSGRAASVPARPLRTAPVECRRRPLSASRTSSRTWTAASTARATCERGRSRRSCRNGCASGTAVPGSRSARRAPS